MDEIPGWKGADTGRAGGSGQWVHIDIVQCVAVGKALRHTGHTVWDMDFPKLPAIVKSRTLDIRQLCPAEFYRFQIPALIECVAADCHHGFTEGNPLQTVTILEHIRADNRELICSMFRLLP